MPKPWKPVQMAAKRSWGVHRDHWNRKPQDLWCNDLQWSAMICNACGTCGLRFWLFGFFVAIGWWSNTWDLWWTHFLSDSRMHIVPRGQHQQRCPLLFVSPSWTCCWTSCIFTVGKRKNRTGGWDGILIILITACSDMFRDSWIHSGSTHSSLRDPTSSCSLIFLLLMPQIAHRYD